MATKMQITSNAFYGNSLSLEREMSDKTAVANGYYTTRYGTVHLYGENYEASTGRKPLFCFDFTYEGRKYRCAFDEWLSDATVRLRAIRFVDACVALSNPSNSTR